MRRIISFFLAFFFSLLSYSQVRFLDSVIHVGKLNADDTVVTIPFRYVVEDATAQILEVDVSCGCTVPEWNADILKKGDTGVLVASFDPKKVHAGPFVKQLSVLFAHAVQRQLLYFKGEVNTTYDGVKALKPSQYKRYFGYDLKISDPASWQSFADSLIVYWSLGNKLDIEIVGSASKVPTNSYDSNEKLAKKRAQELESKLLKYLVSKGVNEYEIIIHLSFSVNGPAYRGDFEDKEKYGPYQYVKAFLR